jgi:hypothetical protein
MEPLPETQSAMLANILANGGEWASHRIVGAFRGTLPPVPSPTELRPPASELDAGFQPSWRPGSKHFLDHLRVPIRPGDANEKEKEMVLER